MKKLVKNGTRAAKRVSKTFKGSSGITYLDGLPLFGISSNVFLNATATIWKFRASSPDFSTGNVLPVGLFPSNWFFIDEESRIHVENGPFTSEKLICHYLGSKHWGSKMAVSKGSVER
ncbi:hypothetical protein RUM44_006392 [Polyplax serrata]|uniref:Uncharacterized protein n=1 Tax=Polyplax serrata TaxID=468196 RepID=A0ABR1AJI2_POLSC